MSTRLEKLGAEVCVQTASDALLKGPLMQTEGIEDCSRESRMFMFDEEMMKEEESGRTNSHQKTNNGSAKYIHFRRSPPSRVDKKLSERLQATAVFSSTETHASKSDVVTTCGGVTLTRPKIPERKSCGRIIVGGADDRTRSREPRERSMEIRIPRKR